MKNSADRRSAPPELKAALEATRRTTGEFGQHAIDEFVAGRLTRRELLRYAGVIGLSLAGGGLFASPRAHAQGTPKGANATIRVAHLMPGGAVDWSIRRIRGLGI